jgi:hypothetical protein
VAACIKAETGVGPSIASGNQVCNPNCADLPIAPRNNNKHIIVKFILLIGPIRIPLITENSNVPNSFINIIIAKTNPMSPTRLTSIALIAALFAFILVNQKLINK